MYHRWTIILGRLVYQGSIQAPPPTYKATAYDFLVQHKTTPFTVFVTDGKAKVHIPVFHAKDANHAQRLKRDHVLQPHQQYV